jgi:N-acetylmuramoyl-L-alanine amidase
MNMIKFLLQFSSYCQGAFRHNGLNVSPGFFHPGKDRADRSDMRLGSRRTRARGRVGGGTFAGLVTCLAILLVAVGVLLPLSTMTAKAQGIIVCLDPGHGGDDSGALGCGLKEKDLNLDIAMQVKPLLQAMGYTVVMTRESDITLSLQDRCDIANRNHSTIFVALHNNAYDASFKGTETYGYYDNVDDARLATYIHTEVVNRIHTVDRGVKQAGFYVLKHTNMTAALLEGAFITNPDDAAQLADPEFRVKIAQGVASGVYKYFNEARMFDTYVLLQNPDPKKAAEVRLSYMTGDGQQVDQDIEVPPQTRRSVHVDDAIYNADVSTHVKSMNGVPIIAERSMYFDFPGGRGAHAAGGVVAPATSWFLAEGCTNWGFSTYILAENPNDAASDVTLNLLRPDGMTGVFKYAMPPRSRLTVDVSQLPAFETTDFSTRVDATKPIVVERAMYFKDHKGMKGGTDSPAVTLPSQTWYLAEGHTGDGFENYILLENPNSQTAGARLTFMLPGGSTRDVDYALAPQSRKTVYVNELEGLGHTDESVAVSSTLPIVAERSMYFNYKGIKEASNSIGAPQPSESWYFAEGCTGNGFDTWLCLLNPLATEAQVYMWCMRDDGVVVEKAVTLAPKARLSIRMNDVPGLDRADFSTRLLSKGGIVAERSMYINNGSKYGGTSAVGSVEPSTDWYFAEGCTR